MSDNFLPPDDPDNDAPRFIDDGDGEQDLPQLSAAQQFINMINARRRAAELEKMRAHLFEDPPAEENAPSPQDLPSDEQDDLSAILEKLPEAPVNLPAWLPDEEADPAQDSAAFADDAADDYRYDDPLPAAEALSPLDFLEAHNADHAYTDDASFSDSAPDEAADETTPAPEDSLDADLARFRRQASPRRAETPIPPNIGAKFRGVEAEPAPPDAAESAALPFSAEDELLPTAEDAAFDGDEYDAIPPDDLDDSGDYYADDIVPYGDEVFYLEEAPDPLAVAEAYEADFLEDEEEAAEPEATAPTSGTAQGRAPKPGEQSTFVNPALARIAAARQRETRTREPSEWWLGFRTIVIISTAALISAFIFNYWTPEGFFSDEFIGGLQSVNSTQGAPTAFPTPIPTYESAKKVGIIAGHSGPAVLADESVEEDPGAICDENNDGIAELRELDINVAVAQQVAINLTQMGYEVEVLQEFDERLPGYRADALVSIHTNTCEFFAEGGATGFNVEPNTQNPLALDRDNRLADCIVNTYAEASGLPRHFGRPPDLVDYHVFREASVDTPIAIVELGFMYENRSLLVDRQPDLARGISEGIHCFLNPESFNASLATESAPSPDAASPSPSPLSPG